MKRTTAAILCLASALLFSGCKQDPTDQNTQKLRGTVLEYAVSCNADGSFADGTMTVVPLDGAEGSTASETYCICIDKITGYQSLDIYDVECGDIVEIFYDGGIEETDDHKLCNVSDIRILQKVSTEIHSELPEIETEDDENKDIVQETAALKEPPALIVSVGENDSLTAMKGTYSWVYRNEDGTETGITADSVHPLQAKDYMPCFENAASTTAVLTWDTTPDKVYVRCWQDEDWGQPDAESEQLEVKTLVVDSNTDTAPVTSFTLKDGNYIYEVIAEWSSFDQFSGKVSYSFYVLEK